MSSRPLEAGSGHQALSDQALAASGLAPTEIERLSGVARSAAAAGAAVLQQFYGHLEQIREKGRAGDLVTEADLAAEAAVLEVHWRGGVMLQAGRYAGGGGRLNVMACRPPQGRC